MLIDASSAVARPLLRAVLLIPLLAVVVVVDAAAQSGVQITPDGGQILISKDVGAERWAIALNAEDGTVTGNVFFPDGGPPQFVWCEELSRAGENVTLACFGAEACPLAPCFEHEWGFIADVTLPESFFRPPAAAAAAAEPRFEVAAQVNGGSGNPPSGLQVSPDRKRNMISKDVGSERWAITYNLADGTVTGNVFFPGGGEPKFVWCAQNSASEQEVVLGCSGADRCAAVPCLREAWSFIADVTLPRSFLFPRS
jgi:hypothetical protein